MWLMRASGVLLVAAGFLSGSVPTSAKQTGLVFISNEKSNTLTVLDQTDTVVKTVKTCARPRGMRFAKNASWLLVGCADDDTVAVYEIPSLKLLRRFRDVAEPETFDLHPDGRHLYISNEEDATASVLDIETGQQTAAYQTGEEPEGVLATPDGKLVLVASEAANLVHVIDVGQNKVIKDILVGTRPRRFALSPDGKEVWVSAELGGLVDIIDMETLAIKDRILFKLPGVRREYITPVDLLITSDGTLAYVALGRANHIAVVDVPSRKVLKYLLVGRRPWGLGLTADGKKLYVANGLSDDLTIIDTATLKVIRSIPVGRVPYGILIDDR